jgi:2,4-dienoyl-CoA reductase (NADPH2)
VIKEDDFPEGMKFPGGVTYETPRELQISEITDMEDRAVQASLRAVTAGFDGIEIPLHRGYLPFSFLSPRINRRNDLYGGSLQNRMRFAVNIIRKTREKIGPDFPLGVELVCNEHVEGGLTIPDCVEIAAILENEGVDYVSLADACYEKTKIALPETDGLMLDHGEPQAFKKVLKIPVIAHSIHSPDLAEKALNEGTADMFETGRQLLVDPEFVAKVREGRTAEIKKCDRDNFCMLRLFLGLPVRCKLNPNLGRERYVSEYWQPAE